MKKLVLVLVSISFLGLLTVNSINAQEAKSKIINLDEANFDSKLKSGLVFVDFYADWCRPCKMMQPVLEEFAEKNQNKVVVAKVNTDKSKNLSKKYNITGIPCMILFKDGKEIKRVVGFKDGAALAKELEGFI